jgi:UDP-N-acetylmuramoyl-tripeptide--D-alanyl-D-alanine ligase
MERLGSREGIAQAKSELFAHLSAQGILVLNTEDQRRLEPWVGQASCPVVWAGSRAEGSDFWVECPGKQEKDRLNYRFYQGEQVVLEGYLPVPGRHNGLNALMAALAARHAGMSWMEIARGLSRVMPEQPRFEYIDCPRLQAALIYDAYNANPDSMAAALETLGEIGTGRRLAAVLGDMYELGTLAREAHMHVGRLAGAAGLDALVTVGALARDIAGGAAMAGMPGDRIYMAADNEAAFRCLRRWIRPGDLILIKGSRNVHMEEIVEAIKEGSDCPSI